jgi:hypothetical protein
LDFDATIAQLSQWIGSPVNVQVLGDAGMVLNIEGVLGRLMGKDGEANPAAFTLDSGGGTFLWLERTSPEDDLGEQRTDRAARRDDGPRSHHQPRASALRAVSVRSGLLAATVSC